MGRNEFTVNEAPEATQRFYFFQRTARFAHRLFGRNDERLGVKEHSCKGPSFLHNLLPILEPILVLDPKLGFLEDRILGRQRAPQKGTSFKVPSSLDELKDWVRDAETPCDCDECAPWLYQLSTKSSHGVIRHRSHQMKGNQRFIQTHHISNQPGPELNLRLYGDYESMRLVRHHIAWLDHTYLQQPSPKPNFNILQIKSLLQTWHPHLTSPNLRDTFSKTQGLHLTSLLNTIFFSNAIPPHRACISDGFSYLSSTEKSCFAIGTFNPIFGTQLLLHPTLYRHHGDPTDLDVRWLSRVGTVLHELCHAYLKAYTCRSCPMHDVCVGPRGHGRAWQLLAKKIEEVATRVLGGFCDMGRYQSALHDFEGSGVLMSRCDLGVLRFGTSWGEGEGAGGSA